MIAFVGALVGLAANALSPRGLQLTRDYFFLAAAPATNPAPSAVSAATSASTNRLSALEQLRARLADKGVSIVDSNQVAQLFQDPRRGQNLVVFLDSRDDKEYQEGHIPGAYQLFYYRPEAHLPTALPACQVAQQVVVYCNGGECIDSELTAGFLLSAGIPRENLLVYPGGMNEWITNGLPVEIGERNSGNFRPTH